MSKHDAFDSHYRFQLGAARFIGPVLIGVGLAGALGAFLDSTVGGGYYGFNDALMCLGLAAFGLFYRVVAPTFLRIVRDAFKEAFK